MEGGPPGFRRDFTCPALLRNRLGVVRFSPKGLSPSMARHSVRGFLRPLPVRLTLFLHVACPTTPMRPKPHRFGLVRFRSPLLAESRLIFLPAGTEMFHFPALSRASLCIQPAVLEDELQRVAPFGNPRIEACLPLPEAYRSLPRPSSSFGAKASTVRP